MCKKAFIGEHYAGDFVQFELLIMSDERGKYELTTAAAAV